MSKDVHPERSIHEFHLGAPEELEKQTDEFAKTLENTAGKLAALDTSALDSWVVERKHLIQAAALLLRYRSAEEAIKAHDALKTVARHDVFISFKTEDGPFANEVCTKLEKARLSAFLAPKSIKPGADWEDSLFDALRRSCVVLFLVTSRSVTSTWCNYEVGAARALEKQVVCACRHVSTAGIPLALRRFQAIDVQTERLVTKLVRTIVELRTQTFSGNS